MRNNISTLTVLLTLRFGLKMFKGVISLTVKIFSKFLILDKLLIVKKRPKLGSQLPIILTNKMVILCIPHTLIAWLALWKSETEA